METAATFRLFGDATRTARHATARLGLTPTKSLEVGDLVSARSDSTRTTSAWLLGEGTPTAGVELETHLRLLVDALTPVRRVLWELVDEGYEADWFCYLASHATEHSAALDQDLLRSIVGLPGRLLLDVCGDCVD